MQVPVKSPMKSGRKALLILLVIFSATYIYLLDPCINIGGSRDVGEKLEISSEAKYQKELMRTLRKLDAAQVISIYMVSLPGDTNANRLINCSIWTWSR